MFDHRDKRYMTKAIADSLHIEIQLLLWQLIDDCREKGKELDYLQVFKLKCKKGRQMILHRQEQPPQNRIVFVTWKEAKPITGTVWCIDDGENQTMLYPSDY